MRRSLPVRSALAVAVLGALLYAVPAGADPRPAAAPVTPAGRPITPAGHSVTVSAGPGLAGPWGVVLSPDGSHALVTSSGQAAQIESTEVFDLTRLQRTDIEPYDGTKGESVFYGVAYSPDGKHAWAAGGGQKVVHT